MTSLEAPITTMISLQPMNLVQAAADLRWSRVIRGGVWPRGVRVRVVALPADRLDPDVVTELDAGPRSLDGAHRTDIKAITHRNAMREFQFDPFSHRPLEQSTVGALRAEATGVDTQVRSSGQSRPAPDGPVTLLALMEKAQGVLDAASGTAPTA